MFFDDPTNQVVNLISSSDISKGAITVLVSAAISAFFTRRATIAGIKKSEAESSKFLSEAHKTDAEAMGINLGIIRDVYVQLESTIEKVKSLRTELDEGDAIKRELLTTVEKVKNDTAEQIQDLKHAFKEERSTLLRSVDQALAKIVAIVHRIKDYDSHPDYIELRREVVLVQELLYFIKNKLEKQD